MKNSIRMYRWDIHVLRDGSRIPTKEHTILRVLHARDNLILGFESLVHSRIRSGKNQLQ